MMAFLTKPGALALPLFTAILALAVVFGTQADSAFQPNAYTMYTASGRRSVLVRPGTPEMVALDQLAGAFGLTLTEDRSANGLIINTKNDRIFAFPGQSFVRAAGKVVALDGQVQRDRNAWLVPIDFLTKALGPSIGEPIVVRRSSRIILVGSVRVPEVSLKVEKTASGASVMLGIQPTAPYRVTRDGNRMNVRIDATALDASAFTGFIPEYVSAAHVDGLNVVIELGPSAATYRVEDDRASSTVTIDLSLAPPPPPRPRPLSIPGAPQLDAPQGGLRTLVIDAGHGGEDEGGVSAGGSKEKDVTLQLARRLKAAVESRLGLRVLLTRDGDNDIPIDRRTEIANNNKADIFLSLHTNWSVRGSARGAQIYMLGLDGYGGPAEADAQKPSVPVLGGGLRAIDPVPWDRAQVPFADQSGSLGSVLTRQFTEHNVPLFVRPAIQGPIRLLMGANMPAVLVELGFLSNADDEKAMASGEWQNAVVESVLATLAEFRRGLADR